MNHEHKTISEGVPTPEFKSKKEVELFAQASLGEDLERFLSSDLGRAMQGMADQEVEIAKEYLLNADPLTPEGQKIIRDAQFKAAVANQFLGFVREIKNVSEQAYQQLMQERDQA